MSDELDNVVAAAGNRHAFYPTSFDWTVSFVTKRFLSRNDKQAFRAFQERATEEYGVELRVIAGGYGCTRLICRIDGASNPDAAAQFIIALLRDRTVELPQELEFHFGRLHNPPVEVNFKTGEIKNADQLRVPLIINNNTRNTTIVKNVGGGSQVVVGSENVQQASGEKATEDWRDYPGKIETILKQLDIHLASCPLADEQRTAVRTTINELVQQLLGKAKSDEIRYVDWHAVQALIKSIKTELPAIFDINRRLRRIHKDLVEAHALAQAERSQPKKEGKRA